MRRDASDGFRMPPCDCMITVGKYKRPVVEDFECKWCSSIWEPWSRRQAFVSAPVCHIRPDVPTLGPVFEAETFTVPESLL